MDKDSPIVQSLPGVLLFISLSSSSYNYISTCELSAVNKESRLVDIVSYNFYSESIFTSQVVQYNIINKYRLPNSLSTIFETYNS